MGDTEKKRKRLGRPPKDKDTATEKQTNFKWNDDMVSYLLSNRLEKMKRSFDGAKNGVMASNAWNKLLLQFNTVFGTTLEVSQIKNKFNDLKKKYREYVSSCKKTGNDSDDEMVPPKHFDVMHVWFIKFPGLFGIDLGDSGASMAEKEEQETWIPSETEDDLKAKPEHDVTSSTEADIITPRPKKIARVDTSTTPATKSTPKSFALADAVGGLASSLEKGLLALAGTENPENNAKEDKLNDTLESISQTLKVQQEISLQILKVLNAQTVDK
jgi:hypothetical protein